MARTGKTSTIDVALADQPELQEKYVKMCCDYGVTLDQLAERLAADGVISPKPASAMHHPKRSAIGRWRFHVRQGVGHQGPFSRLVAAIVQKVLTMSRHEQFALAKSIGADIR